MIEIRSSSNKTYKFIKSLLSKKGRTEHGCFLVEGIKSVAEAQCSGAELELLALRESMIECAAEHIEHAKKAGIQIYTVADGLFSQLCDVKTPEGILCIVRILEESRFEAENGVYLYCDHVSDPGNAGTLIRCADAVGAAGVVFSVGCADIYSPKVVRAAMGSLFHLPVYCGRDAEFLRQMKRRGFYLLAGALSDTAQDYRTAAYPEKTVIVVGNEAHGVSEEVLAACDGTVIIPIAGRAESLNVSAAGAILLYEWQRVNSL